MGNKTVIYTAIFGGYDKLFEPRVHTDDIDYVCFTDNFKLRSEIWQIELSKRFVYWDSVRSARLIKICPHRFLSEYDLSLWVDGNMIVQKAPDVEGLLNGNTIALIKHSLRDCLYEEGGVCQQIPKDNYDTIADQLKAYRKKRFPKKAGLYATGVIARKHKDKDLIPRSEEWWNQVSTYSLRDQLSFPVAFKGYPISYISENEEIHQLKAHLKNEENYEKKESRSVY